MNELGLLGWEAVGVIVRSYGSMLLMKRVIDPYVKKTPESLISDPTSKDSLHVALRKKLDGLPRPIGLRSIVQVISLVNDACYTAQNSEEAAVMIEYMTEHYATR